MTSLQTVAMGLVIVFLDVPPSGWDWVADPVGWGLVLIGLAAAKEYLPNYRGLMATGWVCLAISAFTWPPGSVANLSDFLGWLFSLPTFAFAFLLCDALMEVTSEGLAKRFDILRYVFVAAGALPLLIYLADWEWLTIPTAVVVTLAVVVLVFTLWAAGDEDAPPVTQTVSDAVTKAAETAGKAGQKAKGATAKAKEAGESVRQRAASASSKSPKATAKPSGKSSVRPGVTGKEIVDRVKARRRRTQSQDDS